MEISERSQTIHRSFNTGLSVTVLIIGIALCGALYDSIGDIYNKLSGATLERVHKSEINQIVIDEGYRACPYKDSRGLWTVGFGHLITDGDYKTCMDPHEAISLLRHDYTKSVRHVSRMYPWASEEPKLILINMDYNMGPNRLAKFTNTLKYLEEENYDLAAGEILDSRYASQVGSRAVRLAARTMGLQQ